MFLLVLAIVLHLIPFPVVSFPFLSQSLFLHFFCMQSECEVRSIKYQNFNEVAFFLLCSSNRHAWFSIGLVCSNWHGLTLHKFHCSLAPIYFV